jgi:hypothetical protein
VAVALWDVLFVVFFAVYPLVLRHSVETRGSLRSCPFYSIALRRVERGLQLYMSIPFFPFYIRFLLPGVGLLLATPPTGCVKSTRFPPLLRKAADYFQNAPPCQGVLKVWSTERLHTAPQVYQTYTRSPDKGHTRLGLGLGLGLELRLGLGPGAGARRGLGRGRGIWPGLERVPVVSNSQTVRLGSARLGASRAVVLMATSTAGLGVVLALALAVALALALALAFAPAPAALPLPSLLLQLLLWHLR